MNIKTIYFILILEVLLIKSEKNFCTKFLLEKKEDINFVTINVGTPITPYRLLLCTNPYVKNMHFYNVVLFSSSFGNGLTENTNVDVHENIKHTQNNKKPLNTQKVAVSKSVTFTEIFTDNWSTIGHDFVRTIDGTWIDAGIEIPNLQDSFSIFSAYCNPGGFGDARSIEYEPKYDEFDGFFLIQKDLTLVFNQNGNVGTSSYIIRDNMLEYCYNTLKPSLNIAKNSLISGTLTNHDTTAFGSTQNLGDQFSNLKYFVNDGRLYYRRVTKHTPRRNLSEVTDTHMQSFMDHNTLSSNMGLSGKSFSSSLFFPQEINDKTSISSYVSWVYDKDPERHKLLQIDTILMSVQHDQSVSKTSPKRSVLEKKQHSKMDVNILFNLDQPYTYIPKDIFDAYTKVKNYVVDIPDEQWSNLCFSLNSNTNSGKNNICLGGSKLLKQTYTTQRKGGYVSYFPQPNIESMSVTDMTNIAVSLYGTVHGGRFWGNTLVEKNAKYLKKTSFAKSKPNIMMNYGDDSYTKNSRQSAYKKYHSSGNIFVSQNTKHSTDDNIHNDFTMERYKEIWKNSFETQSFIHSSQTKLHTFTPVRSFDVHTQDTTPKLNRLNIIPHSGDQDIVYLGSSFIFQNTLGVKLSVDYKDSSVSIASNIPTGFEKSFLTQNVDINNEDFLFYFIISTLFVISFVDMLFTIKSTVNHQLLFDVFDMKSHGAFQKKGKHLPSIKTVKFMHILENKHKPFFVKDLMFYGAEFMIFTILFVALSRNGFVTLFQGYGSMLSHLTNVEHTATSASVQVTFTITTTFILVSVFLSFLTIMYTYFVEYGKHVRRNISKVVFGVNRLVRFDNWMTKTVSTDITTKIMLLDQEKKIDLYKHEQTDYQKQTVYNFLYSKTVKQNAISYITSLFNLTIFITSVTYFISISSQSSSVLRFWNLTALIILTYICTYAILFSAFILRLFSNKKHLTHKQTKVMTKTARFMWINLIIYIIVFALSVYALVIYIVPYELNSYQVDYSKYPINYLVSILCVLAIVTIAVEVWETNWKNTDSFRFSYYALHAVFNREPIKMD